MFGSQDALIGLVIALFLFGAKKLPDLAASLGKSVKEFKKATEAASEAGSASTAPRPPAVPVAPSRTCASCQTPLAAGWAHCPKCGTVVTPTSTPVPPAA